MNDYNVICVGDKRLSGYECRKNGLLITLQPSDNPTTVMNDLFDINNRIRGGGITRGRSTIDLVSFLDSVPVMESTAVSETVPSPVPSPDSPRGMSVPPELQ
jgi:hypothetical protein